MNLYEIEFFKIYDDGKRVKKLHQTCVNGSEWDACAQLGQIFSGTYHDYDIEILSVKRVGLHQYMKGNL